MTRAVVILFSLACTFLYAAESDFTERFERSSVFGKWIDIDKGKIIEINSKSKFSFERLDNDLIILKNGAKKSYLKRVGRAKTKIKGRIVQENGASFSAVSRTRVTLTNINDSSIQAKVITNSEGYFDDETLPSGDYSLSVTKGRLSLKVPVSLKHKSEALGTFVITQAKSAVFKSKLSMDGTFIISNRKRHKATVEIFNYGHKKGKVCYSAALKDSKLRELRFSKACKVIPAGKSIKQSLYVSFNPITINSTEKVLDIKMIDDKGRSVVESHPFDVYKNFFNLKIKTPNKAMKGYVVLPGQELMTIDIKKGRLALPKLSDEEYKLILANTDPRQKTVYEVDVGTAHNLSRGGKKKKSGSARRGQKNRTFALKQSIARYPNVGDIAVYSFMIPDSIVMHEHDKAIKVRFVRKDRLGEPIAYKATIANSKLAKVSYKNGYLTVIPAENSNGITTIVLKDPKGYGRSQKKLFTLYIKAVNDKPRITSKPVLKALEDNTYRYYFKGVDAETRYLRTKALKLPKWLKYDRKKSLLYGKPKEKDVGEHKVVLSLTDGMHVLKQSFAVNVLALNKAPESNNVFFTVNEDSVLKNQLKAKVKKGKTVSFTLATKPEHGKVLLDTKGKFTYTPHANFYGSDSFKIKVSSSGQSVESMVNIAVKGVNDIPEAQNIYINNVGAGPVEIDWMEASQAKDIDEDQLYITVEKRPKLGTLTIDDDNHIIYIPKADTNGQEVVYLNVEDGSGQKRPITLTLSGIAKLLTPRVLQTGQKVIYHPFDDAIYKKSLPRSYEIDLKQQVVKDKTLKKTWYIGEKSGDMEFNKAQAYCQDLSVGIVSNWRLPTVEELVMLTNKGRTNPAIDPIFVNVSSDYYWTSTPYTQRKSYRWTVYMDYGNDYFHHEKSKQKVLCVRDGIGFLHKSDLTPEMIVAAQKEAERIEDGGKVVEVNATKEVKDFRRIASRSVVWDKEMELIWDDRKKVETATWVGAIKICEQLSLDGRKDWRVPNFNELYAISEHNGSKPAIVSAFKNSQAEPYWSSTSADNDGDRAWGISFNDGSDFTYDKTEQINVRCVRDQ